MCKCSMQSGLPNFSAEQLMILLHAKNMHGYNPWSYKKSADELTEMGIGVSVYHSLSTAHVNKLKTQGLIDVIPNPEDRRSNLCVLTKQGDTCTNCIANAIKGNSPSDITIAHNCSVKLREIPAKLLIVILYAFVNYKNDPWSYQEVVRDMQFKGFGIDTYPQLETSHINKLKKLGLIETVPDKDDKRFVKCIWTEKSKGCCLSNMAGSFSKATSSKQPVLDIIGCELWGSACA